MTRQPKRTANLEIEYEFNPTDRHCRIHWMYYKASGVTMEDMIKDATNYYNKQIRSLGWGKIATLKEIRPLRGVHDPAKKVTVTEDKPQPKSRRRTSRKKTR